MNISDYTGAIAKSLLPLVPGGQAIAVVIEDPNFQEANKKIAKALEPITQPVVQVFKDGAKQLGLSKADDLYPLLTDMLKKAQEEEQQRNKEITLLDQQQTRRTEQESQRLIQEARHAEIQAQETRRNEAIVQQAYEQDRRAQQREYEERQQALINERIQAENNRAELAKSEPVCTDKCNEILRIIRAFAANNIFLNASFFKGLDPSFVRTAAKEKAQHNLPNLLSFAKIHPDLGLSRFIKGIVDRSNDSSLKKLIEKDTHLPSHNDILSAHGATAIQLA